jgi:hypothetical protein
MWYVTKHSRTELDEEIPICVGIKGFYGQCWMLLDAVQADALSAKIKWARRAHFVLGEGIG